MAAMAGIRKCDLGFDLNKKGGDYKTMQVERGSEMYNALLDMNNFDKHLKGKFEYVSNQDITSKSKKMTCKYDCECCKFSTVR